MSHNITTPSSSGRAAVDTFFEAKRLQRLQQQTAGGRLIFALDATASRQPTWNTACELTFFTTAI